MENPLKYPNILFIIQYYVKKIPICVKYLLKSLLFQIRRNVLWKTTQVEENELVNWDYLPFSKMLSRTE